MNIPEGATHYIPSEQPEYFKVLPGVFEVWYSKRGGWHSTYDSYESIKDKLIEIKGERMEKYWMVHNASTGSSTQNTHKTYTLAAAEARRLAECNHSLVFTVLEVMDAYKVSRPAAEQVQVFDRSKG